MPLSDPDCKTRPRRSARIDAGSTSRRGLNLPIFEEAPASRTPPVAGEFQPIGVVESYALAFQQLALDGVSTRLGAWADLTARIDNAMPRHGALGCHRMKRIAHLPGVTTQASQRRDLSIGRHASMRNAANDGVDPAVTTLPNFHRGPSSRSVLFFERFWRAVSLRGSLTVRE